MPGRKYFGTFACGVSLLGLGLLILWLIVPVTPPAAPTDPLPDDAAVLERVAACQDAPLTYLIAHTSDNDWRVRAAAYAELAKHAPIENVPLRDTPIDQREATSLDWLDQNASDLASDMCEFYTQLNHLRFGRPLVQRCLTCHVGREPEPQLADTRCIACHESIHQQWAGTAHANSLSHLPLLTIDPATRQQTPFDFGDRKGMSCVACHTPTDHAAEGKLPAKLDGKDCVATFTAVSCGVCHAQAQTQWQTWREMPHYRRAVWPPGSLELADEEPKSCAGCHMPDSEHLWAARRSIPLLQSGLTMNVSRDPNGQAAITLRNLAGHNYPAGRTRRAMHLYAQLDDEPERLIATLADSLPGTANPTIIVPTLAPGEARVIPLPGHADRVQARLVYARNRFVHEAYTVEITSIDHTFPTTADTEQ